MVHMLMLKMLQNNLGIDGLFDGAFDIVDANFMSKTTLRSISKINKKI